MPTTAEYRRQARYYESQLLWTRAAEAWELAIKAYPVSPKGEGQLEKADKAKMTRRAESCHHSAASRFA